MCIRTCWSREVECHGGPEYSLNGSPGGFDERERESAREREREIESTYMVDGLPGGFDVWVGVFVCGDT